MSDYTITDGILLLCDIVIDEINGVPVPLLRELLVASNNTYIGVTIDGNLFSLRTGQILNLGSPITAAYVNDPNDRLILVLLENGRLRLINNNKYDNYRLHNFNSVQIDTIIPQFVTELRPIKVIDNNRASRWLVISSTESLRIKIRRMKGITYSNDRRRSYIIHQNGTIHIQYHSSVVIIE